jgi:hypothetical protein
MLQLGSRVLHAPSTTHGVARCGWAMDDPWSCGPFEVLGEHALWLCHDCFPGGVLEPSDVL